MLEMVNMSRNQSYKSYIYIHMCETKDKHHYIHICTFRYISSIMDFLDPFFYTHTHKTTFPFPFPIKQLQSRDLWWDTHELLNTGSSRPGRVRHRVTSTHRVPPMIHRTAIDHGTKKNICPFLGWWCWFSETWRCFFQKKIYGGHLSWFLGHMKTIAPNRSHKNG